MQFAIELHNISQHDEKEKMSQHAHIDQFQKIHILTKIISDTYNKIRNRAICTAK